VVRPRAEDGGSGPTIPTMLALPSMDSCAARNPTPAGVAYQIPSVVNPLRDRCRGRKIGDIRESGGLALRARPPATLRVAIRRRDRAERNAFASNGRRRLLRKPNARSILRPRLCASPSAVDDN